MPNLKTLATLAAISVAIGAGSVHATAHSHPNASEDGPDYPFHCEVSATQKGSMVELTAFAASHVDMNGQYRIFLTSKSGSNSTRISQGGWFELKAGEETTLSRNMLSGTAANYEVALEVDSTVGSQTCHLPA